MASISTARYINSFLTGDNNVWCATNKGLYRYDLADKQDASGKI